MLRSFPIFMDDVPDYQVRGDNMHIVWPSLELVLPIPTMLAGMGTAKRELDKWFATNARVVDIPGCKRHAASS